MTPLDIAPIQRRHTHEFVAEELRRVILLRVVSPGDRLPIEGELAELLDVSHVTMRQALRELERDGLVELRRGRLGGAYVRGVPELGGSDQRLAELRRDGAAVREALEFRQVIEPECAALAATDPTTEDLESIGAARDAVARREGGPDEAFMSADTAFHLAIGAATANTYMASALEQIHAAIAPAIQALPETGRWHARSTEEHRAITDRIAAGDPNGARTVMQRHIEETERAALLLIDGLGRRRGRAGRDRPPRA